MVCQFHPAQHCILKLHVLILLPTTTTLPSRPTMVFPPAAYPLPWYISPKTHNDSKLGVSSFTLFNISVVEKTVTIHHCALVLDVCLWTSLMNLCICLAHTVRPQPPLQTQQKPNSFMPHTKLWERSSFCWNWPSGSQERQTFVHQLLLHCVCSLYLTYLDHNLP